MLLKRNLHTLTRFGIRTKLSDFCCVKKIYKQQHINCECLRLVERLLELLQSTADTKSSAKEMRVYLMEQPLN